MSSIFTVCYSDLRCSASSLHSVPSPFLFLRSRLAVELVITNVRPARLFSFSFFIIYLYSGVSFVLFFLLPSRYAHSEFLFRCFFCCYHFLMIFCWYSSVSRRHSSEGTESSALCYYRERKTTARRCGWTCSLPFNSPWLLFFFSFFECILWRGHPSLCTHHRMILSCCHLSANWMSYVLSHVLARSFLIHHQVRIYLIRFIWCVNRYTCAALTLSLTWVYFLWYIAAS